MSHRYRTHWLRRAVAVATWTVLPSAAILAIAACAVSNETHAEPDFGPGTVVPSDDAGDEASSDAAVEADAPAVSCVPEELCSAQSPLALGAVTAISGRSKNDVWASGTRGVLMHWNGQQWDALDSGISETLTSISLSADEVWGVGGLRVLRRGLDPNSVRQMMAFDNWLRPLASISVLSNGDLYVGLTSRITEYGPDPIPFAKLDFENQTLAYEPDPVHPSTHEAQLPVLQAGFMVPDKALWLVGDRAAVVRYPISHPDGGAPVVGQGVMVPVASYVDLSAAWGYDDQLWTVGRGGALLHFDGTDWHVENANTTANLNAVFGLSPTDIWAAGDDGTVLHFDGKTWSRIGAGAYRGSLRAIWGAGHDDIWFGGEGGMFHVGAHP